MFSWICPQCGHDVPPSKTDCPYCAERAAEAAAALAAQGIAPGMPPQGMPLQGYPPQGYPVPGAPPPAQAAAEPWNNPQWQPPVQPYVPPPPPPQAYVPPPASVQQYAPPPGYVPPPPQAWQKPPVAQAAWHPPAPRRGLPSWVVGAGVAIGLIGILAAFYMVMQRSSSGTAPSGTTITASDSATPGKGKITNPLQKYVEIAGLRMVTENKEPTAKFVVVNHSGGEISDLAANVTLWASTSRSEEDSIGTFSFKLGSIGPNDSKELSAPLKTKLKMYELPDWQNATAEIQITSPAAN